MKIANVLTASVVFAFASLIAAVGCSSPTSAPLSTGAADTTKASGDSTDNTSTPASSTTTTTTTTSTADGGTSTSSTASDAACISCVGASSKAGVMITCQDACAQTDDNCFDSCWTNNCGTDTTGNDACTPALDKCDSSCGGSDSSTAPTAAQVQACDSCVVAANAKAGAFVKCDDACTDDTCDNTCWTSSGCSSDETTCNNALDSCATQCGQ